ncbi:MAG: hypothetical protein HY034_04165 [Nitrospirae bacterium]|nr:hypothetical protein [Nitrospirota bacterium]
MLIDEIAKWTGKKVEVMASDIAYKGILIEVTEEEINLQGEFQWIAIPMEKVTSVRPINH